MENNNNFNKNKQNIIKIRDTKGIFKFVMWSIGISLFIGYWVGVFTRSTFLSVAIIILLLAVGYKRIKVMLEGVILDLRKNIISFPGGDITFNSTEETFENVLQYFQIYSWNIYDITHISTHNKHDFDKNGNVHYSYNLLFTGIPGAVELEFSNQGQRDQLYSLIVSINEMGIPVVNK